MTTAKVQFDLLKQYTLDAPLAVPAEKLTQPSPGGEMTYYAAHCPACGSRKAASPATGTAAAAKVYCLCGRWLALSEGVPEGG